MNINRNVEGAILEHDHSVDCFEEPFDDSFKETLTSQERFRYEVLVYMKKNGFKLINSKCFKKKDIYIPVSDIENFYKENNEIDLNEIFETLDLANSY